MKKLIAIFGILALAACGGGDDEAAVTEDTTSVAPATETAPVVTPPADTTMAAPMTTDTGMAAPMGDTTGADTPSTTTPYFPAHPRGGTGRARTFASGPGFFSTKVRKYESAGVRGVSRHGHRSGVPAPSALGMSPQADDEARR
jgi:hypothetical protein